MMLTFIIGQSFLTMLCHLKFRLFYFFAVWMLVMTTFIVLFLPETKGVAIKEMWQVWSHTSSGESTSQEATTAATTGE
ncbi:hypothetical protein PR202_gb28652 [Eleusine coracana subsp. coracana]|uniref:Major facilitator superfamily (MFS) profile domain-containing protein n=1 Tax=Eleusine coracana subsp. coracana TaxID=191504 RepID=A0AAV5FWX0_ELECO|nr:hypothetical protein PR202_gb28652 [Eleusine coracana subsp. coracana]